MPRGATVRSLWSEVVAAHTLVGAQREVIEKLRARVDELIDQDRVIETLRAEVAELKARLAMNSRNSSKPPASDGYDKPAPRSLRRPSGRKPGKQPGTPGSRLEPVAEPDEVISHAPTACSDCGGGLEDAEVVGREARQVFDLPPMRAEVTEHQVEKRRCRCGAVTAGAFPPQARAPTCYGPRVRALAVDLVVGQHLPYERAAELLRDALGTPVSVGAICSMVAEASASLEPFLDAVRQGLGRCRVVHFDETGGRVKAKLWWVHAASTEALTLYLVHPRRGILAMDAMGVLPGFFGVAQHDGWTPYLSYHDATHALCNAHHLRELKYVADQMGQGWADDMATLLVEIKEAVGRAIDGDKTALDPRLMGRYLARYDRDIAAGRAANPAPEPIPHKRGRPAKSKAANLVERLDLQRDDVLRFATDFAVDFDNNLSERDVRMMKLQNKVSGGWRSEAGARAWVRIRSYLSTAKKQGQGALDVLSQLFAGQCWMPLLPGP
ncbi:MAG: IS66 family transposase [Acidimicrobiales bacterium]